MGDNAYYAELLTFVTSKEGRYGAPTLQSYIDAGRIPTDAVVPKADREDTDFGLATKLAIDSFITSLRSAAATWTDSPDCGGRVASIAAVVNASLTAIGVPAVNVQGGKVSGAEAFFRGADWSITIDTAALAGARDDNGLEGLATYVLHECRHAEQHFRMAQRLASDGEDLATIVAGAEVTELIAELAQERTADPGHAAAAEAWLASEAAEADAYAAGVVDATRDLKVASEAADAVVEHLKGPFHGKDARRRAEAEKVKARAEFEAAYALYQNLPLEADAWDVTHAVDDSWDGERDQQ